MAGISWSGTHEKADESSWCAVDEQKSEVPRSSRAADERQSSSKRPKQRILAPSSKPRSNTHLAQNLYRTLTAFLPPSPSPSPFHPLFLPLAGPSSLSPILLNQILTLVNSSSVRALTRTCPLRACGTPEASAEGFEGVVRAGAEEGEKVGEGLVVEGEGQSWMNRLRRL